MFRARAAERAGMGCFGGSPGYIMGACLLLCTELVYSFKVERSFGARVPGSEGVVSPGFWLKLGVLENFQCLS